MYTNEQFNKDLSKFKFNVKWDYTIKVDGYYQYIPKNKNIKNPQSSDLKQVVTVKDLLESFETEQEFLDFIYNHKITIEEGFIADHEYWETCLKKDR